MGGKTQAVRLKRRRFFFPRVSQEAPVLGRETGNVDKEDAKVSIKPQALVVFVVLHWLRYAPIPSIPT